MFIATIVACLLLITFLSPIESWCCLLLCCLRLSGREVEGLRPFPLTEGREPGTLPNRLQSTLEQRKLSKYKKGGFPPFWSRKGRSPSTSRLDRWRENSILLAGQIIQENIIYGDGIPWSTSVLK